MFVKDDPTGTSGEDVMLGTFAMMFGAFSAGQAN
jgi:hypothetical protein